MAIVYPNCGVLVMILMAVVRLIISREALWSAVAPATAFNLLQDSEFVNFGFGVVERV
jgi:hypothetical protein